MEAGRPSEEIDDLQHHLHPLSEHATRQTGRICARRVLVDNANFNWRTGHRSRSRLGDYVPQEVLTAGQVVRWWEQRRLLYNLVRILAGVPAIAGMEWLMTKVLQLGEDAVEPMILVLGVVGYGVMANLCYTPGWVIELQGRKAVALHIKWRPSVLAIWHICTLCDPARPGAPQLLSRHK